jgi:hypothetical protein
MIPPPTQEFLSKRMKAIVRSVSSSHCPFVSPKKPSQTSIALAADSLRSIEGGISMIALVCKTVEGWPA